MKISQIGNQISSNYKVRQLERKINKGDYMVEIDEVAKLIKGNDEYEKKILPILWDKETQKELWNKNERVTYKDFSRFCGIIENWPQFQKEGEDFIISLNDAEYSLWFVKKSLSRNLQAHFNIILSAEVKRLKGLKDVRTYRGDFTDFLDYLYGAQEPEVQKFGKNVFDNLDKLPLSFDYKKELLNKYCPQSINVNKLAEDFLNQDDSYIRKNIPDFIYANYKKITDDSIKQRIADYVCNSDDCRLVAWAVDTIEMDRMDIHKLENTLMKDSYYNFVLLELLKYKKCDVSKIESFLLKNANFEELYDYANVSPNPNLDKVVKRMENLHANSKIYKAQRITNADISQYEADEYYESIHKWHDLLPGMNTPSKEEITQILHNREVNKANRSIEAYQKEEQMIHKIKELQAKAESKKDLEKGR